MKTTGIIIGALVVLVVGTFIFMGQDNSPEVVTTDITGSTANINTDSNNSSNSTTTSTSTAGTSTSTGVIVYTNAQVATHNSKTSCWSVIDRNIYDLTSWISKHPGGQAAILQLCGKDGTAIFHGQHGNAKQQADILATFKIGTLAN